MKPSNRLTLIKIHMLLAAFIFPVALMFLITGGLYTWSIKGSYSNTVHRINLSQPLIADANTLREFMQLELDRLDIDPPSGNVTIKKGGTSYKAEWTGSVRDVVLHPTANKLKAKMVIKDTTWYRQLVQLHKAKGGQFFKVYAALLAVSLFTILLTGFVIALQIPKYRNSAILATLAGIAMFVAMIASS